MFSGLQPHELRSAIEALLFISDAPVGVVVLADIVQATPSEVEQALESLAQDLEKRDAGIRLRERAGGWQFCTEPRYHELLESYVLSWDTRKLSQAALEVLAVIAWAEPITRGAIAHIRGVNSDGPLKSLLEKGLIREAGCADSPGNPVLYATSKQFLERFGLKTRKDLPPLEVYAPDEETKNLIAERLGASKLEVVQRTGDEGLQKHGILDGEEGTQEDSDSSDSPVPSTSAPELLKAAMKNTLSEALASSYGTVEKIDFDDLEFEE